MIKVAFLLGDMFNVSAVLSLLFIECQGNKQRVCLVKGRQSNLASTGEFFNSSTDQLQMQLLWSKIVFVHKAINQLMN